MAAVAGRSTESLAIMWRRAILVIWVPIVATASETCTVVNPQSVVDQAFISAMANSSIANTRPRRDWLCYADADEGAVAVIREKVHTANQPECVIFGASSEVAAVEGALVGESIRSWRESSLKLCYLAKDGKAVRNAIDRAGRKRHDG
jgi:hypothetical protein